MADQPVPPAPQELPRLPCHKGPGRRAGTAPLTRERIVEAAIAILDAEGLDAEGLDAVGTRRVAEALGTGSASLDAHLNGRGELVDLMVDRIDAELIVPEPDPQHWAERLEAYAHGARVVWAAHADIARASLAVVPTGPNRLRMFEGLLAIFRAAGFTDQSAVWAIDRLNLYIEADVYEAPCTRPSTAPASTPKCTSIRSAATSARCPPSGSRSYHPWPTPSPGSPTATSASSSASTS